TCDCDHPGLGNVCEAASRNSSATCDCDQDCGAGESACGSDGHCDSWCPEGDDPDCDPGCECEYFDTAGLCEAESDQSTRECGCDEDCDPAGEQSCQADGHCDNFCDPGGICKDPDCDGDEGDGYLTGECDRS
ncbi:MAG: hypothetical protein KC561_15035, partial [Myxococcales bacterium]|nr:hypothetical protein [Myxococcales bacterium]